MVALGEQMLGHADELHAQQDFLHRHAAFLDISGVRTMIVQSDDTMGVQKFRDLHHPDAGICISWDDRGKGWTLYRFNDHPKVDFSRL